MIGLLQYNELAKLCGTSALTTPPLSLASSPKCLAKETEEPSAADIMAKHEDFDGAESAQQVRAAAQAALLLQKDCVDTQRVGSDVRTRSGPSVSIPGARSTTMPSISESPLEQDFTIEGKPSKLGCPFANMAKRKLSSHAASVLGRYSPGSVGGTSSVAARSVNRIDGRDSFTKRQEQRPSFPDPIKAEICGLSDHDEESPFSERAIRAQPDKAEAAADAGVCPIRFLDQHSPEEVATYFERHKHELPRSHEVCVRRYQSNEQQIRELDAKYGTLVSMIQGLGAKHKGYLPLEPEDPIVSPPEDGAMEDDKVRRWASSVSAQVPEGDERAGDDDDRQSRFDRPLREVRVGESPSRPWGIHVPAQYAEAQKVTASSEIPRPPDGPINVVDGARTLNTGAMEQTAAAKCPFGFDKAKEEKLAQSAKGKEYGPAQPVFINNETFEKEVTGKDPVRPGGMVLNGPVFIGYSVEDAAKVLQLAAVRS